MKNIKDLIKKRWFANALAGCITVAFYLILSNISSVWDTITQFIGYFSTVIGGAVIAYLMNPLAEFYNKKVFKKLKSQSAQWTFSIVCSVVTVVVFVGVLMSMLIPQLFESITTFVGNIDSYAKALQSFLHTSIKNYEKFEHLVVSSENIINTTVNYIKDNSSKIIDISTSAGKSVVTWIIAFILSVYMLSAKHRLQDGTKQFMETTLSEEHYNSIMNFLNRCNFILNRYVVFSLIDGIIVGTVNAVFMFIFGMQYIGLVSVVVGVTNLVPTFGPIVGGVIGGFILLMVKPFHALIFIIFIILLQTVDGYIIKPKLFGNTLGISGLLILLFILVGGSIWGIIGILIAIPLAAITDYVYREMLIPYLKNRHMKAKNNPKKADRQQENNPAVSEEKPKAVKNIGKSGGKK